MLVSTLLGSKVAVDRVSLGLMGQVGHGLESGSTFKESNKVISRSVGGNYS